MQNIKTEIVSPLALVVGDKVLMHGEVMEVTHIIRQTYDGVEVASCWSKLVGEQQHDVIPHGWWQKPADMAERGAAWAKNLPEGLYWNVQGNGKAGVHRIID